MNERELRDLIRAAVERHLGAPPAPATPQAASARPIAMTDVRRCLYLSLPSVGDAWLQLRVGVFPQLDERAVILRGLLGVPD